MPMTFDTDRSQRQAARVDLVSAALRAGQPDGYLAQRKRERSEAVMQSLHGQTWWRDLAFLRKNNLGFPT